MEHLIALGLSAYDDDPIDELLVQYEPLLQTEVRKAVRSFSSDGILELEIDELAQEVRIKLWKACQKQRIKNPRAYIMAITRTTAIDIIRRHKPVLSLSNSAYEELGLIDLLMAQNEGFQDPALETELEEVEPLFLASLVEAILSLPPRQKHAVLLAIKDHQADSYLLIGALKARGVDIETISQPEERSELYLLRASLSVARKKLRALCERTIAV